MPNTRRYGTMEVNNKAATAPVAITENEVEVRRAKSKTSLRWAALFLGELRDGLTMVCTVLPSSRLLVI